MNRLIHILCFCAIIPFSRECAGQNIPSEVQSPEQINIDPTLSYQTVEGWGSSLCWWAAQVGAWDETKADSIVDLITSPDKLNMNIFRYNIGGGDDPSHIDGHMVKGKGKRAEMEGFKASAEAPYNWATDKGQRIIMLKIKAKRPDAVFEAFSNSPPYWMTYSGCSGGNIDPMQDNLKPEYYEAFCDYLIEVCKFYKEQYNIGFKTLEPFNESTSGYWNALGSQEGCHFTPETQMKIIRILAPKLKSSGLETVLSASDETNIASSIKVLKAYQSAGNILDKIGQLNTHTYSGTNSERKEVHQLVKSTGKPFWQSETGPSGNQKTSFATNLGLAQKLFDDMHYMKPQAWLDWQLLEENNNVWCLIRCNFMSQKYKVIKNFYVRMQITRFFKQAYTIIETRNDEVLAAINPDKTELVVAILNHSTELKPFKLNLEAFPKPGTKIQVYRTTNLENCENISSPGLNDQSIRYNAPGLSLTTFIIPVEN
ncbi:MAG TPA: glycoside hydrolase [Prolixibacteraceae bacterium]|nr:glycoside hydrolase [Prolixibacteraceae bacterium]